VGYVTVILVKDYVANPDHNAQILYWGLLGLPFLLSLKILTFLRYDKTIIPLGYSMAAVQSIIHFDVGGA
jgi:hypothetical protein